MLELFLFATVSSYHIGNSLMNDGLGNNSGTVQNGTYGIEAIAESYGYDYTLAMHIDSSQGLTSIWNNPDGVGVVDAKRTPYGPFSNALVNYEWDHVLLEPWLIAGDTLGSDKVAITNFVNLAQQNPENEDTVFYVYQFWPQQSFGDYSTYWLGPFPNDDYSPTRPRREYYQNLIDWADETYTSQGTLVRQVPNGEVWHRAYQAIAAGEITEITMADLYRDDLHASGSLGRYLAATTTFATIFQRDVNGLVPPATQFGQNYSLELYQQLNRIIWEVVSSDPYTGIADFNDDGRVSGVDLALWAESYGVNASADADGDGDTDGRDFLIWQRAARSASPPAMSSVPEPAAVSFLLWLTMANCRGSRQLRRSRRLYTTPPFSAN